MLLLNIYKDIFIIVLRVSPKINNVVVNWAYLFINSDQSQD